MQLVFDIISIIISLQTNPKKFITDCSYLKYSEKLELVINKCWKSNSIPDPDRGFKHYFLRLIKINNKFFKKKNNFFPFSTNTGKSSKS